MTQIIPSGFEIAAEDSTEFVPMRGVANRHLQTMLPRLIRRKVQFTPHWQRLDLPDGDFLDLAWSEAPDQARHKPRLVVFHGLEGSLHSPYAHGLIEAAKARGWLGVVMHFRGCSGEPNRQKRIYHSGETEDGESVPLDAAVIVSAPFMLEQCSYHMDKGFSRVYQRYLLNLLKANAARKLKAYPDTLPVSLRQLKKVRRIREFDDLITAKIHGFADAIDYYRQCSAMPLLSKITQPTLIIHAKDDPFMDHHSIPAQEFLPDNVHYQLTEHGGHVGFIGGTLRRPKMWLEARIPDWLTPYLDGAK